MRRFSAVAVIRTAVATALLLAPAPGGAQKGPIKVGLILPETGPLAANGKDMANGMQLFFEEQGWKLAGREIRLITEDDEGKPPTGLAKARSLVERVGGKLQNTVIHTFPNVSQFWTFKREDFLKNPVYSRDYPPCTKC